MLDLITTHSQGWFLPVIVAAALVDSINPCAFSILFLTLTFLFSLGKDRKFILYAGAFYIFGIALVYTLIGVGVLKVLSLFAVPNVLAKIGASILILYGLIELINEYYPAFPIKLKIPTQSHTFLASLIHKGSLPISFALGILVGLFEFPCTGGPYLFVLGLLHDHQTFFSGFLYLILYNFIFVLPLIVMLIVAANQNVLTRLDSFRRLETKRSRTFLSLIVIALGLIIIFFI